MDMAIYIYGNVGCLFEEVRVQSTCQGGSYHFKPFYLIYVRFAFAISPISSFTARRLIFVMGQRQMRNNQHSSDCTHSLKLKNTPFFCRINNYALRLSMFMFQF